MKDELQSLLLHHLLVHFTPPPLSPPPLLPPPPLPLLLLLLLLLFFLVHSSSVQIWKCNSGVVVTSWKHSDRWVTSCAFSPRGDTVAIVGDGLLQVCPLHTVQYTQNILCLCLFLHSFDPLILFHPPSFNPTCTSLPPFLFSPTVVESGW